MTDRTALADELLLRAIVSQHTTAGFVDGFAVAKSAYRLAALRAEPAKPEVDREKVARAIMLSTDADPDVMIGMMGDLPKWVWDAADAAIAAMKGQP
jgi:hypothetical protein